MRISRRRNSTAPGVFYRHGYAGICADVANDAGGRQPTEFADLEGNGIHGVVPDAALELIQGVESLVQFDRMPGTAPDRQALFVAAAGLFQVNIHILDGL